MNNKDWVSKKATPGAAGVATRIIKEIEELVTQPYPGQGMLGPRMFIELPKAM